MEKRDQQAQVNSIKSTPLRPLTDNTFIVFLSHSIVEMIVRLPSQQHNEKGLSL